MSYSACLLESLPLFACACLSLSLYLCLSLSRCSPYNTILRLKWTSVSGCTVKVQAQPAQLVVATASTNNGQPQIAHSV